MERGIYCHTIRDIDLKGIDRVTILGNEFPTHCSCTVSQGLDKKKLKQTGSWKDVTVMAYRGLDLEKTCRMLVEEHMQVRIALPAELVESFEWGGIAALRLGVDLMAFDYHRPKTGYSTNFHALIPAIDQTVNYLHRAGIHRLYLGLTTKGVIYKNVPQGSQAGYGEPCGEGQLDLPEMSGNAIEQYLAAHAPARIFYTSFQGCFQSFIYNPVEHDWISFDDLTTRSSKMEWARRRGFLGTALHV